MVHIWPIGGGKGGSGKSFLTSTLGRLLAESGKRTLIIDLDLGAANLHTLLDVPYPTKSLSDFIRRKIPLLQDVILPTSTPNLFLISGAHDSLDIANLAYEQKIKTLKAISKLDYDWILLDLGAGTSFNTLDFFLISQYGIFITTPEPTSIENVYRLVRAIYFRRIRHSFDVAYFQQIEKEVARQFGDDSIYKPNCMMEVVKRLHPDIYIKLDNAISSFGFKLILNQLRKQDSATIGSQICQIIGKHLGIRIEFAGNVSYDDHIHDAICQRVSFLDRYPHARAVADLRGISRQLVRSADEQLLRHCS